MIAWCEEGCEPDSFWKQTPRTFMAIMEGRARAAKRELKLPWLTEFFARQKALKSFDSYFAPVATSEDRGSSAVLAAFRDMEKRGVAMTIKRLN